MSASSTLINRALDAAQKADDAGHDGSAQALRRMAVRWLEEKADALATRRVVDEDDALLRPTQLRLLEMRVASALRRATPDTYEHALLEHNADALGRLLVAQSA
jgi:hypothetical protein